MQNILEYARLKEIKERDCYEKENHFSCHCCFCSSSQWSICSNQMFKDKFKPRTGKCCRKKDEEFNLQEEEQSKDEITTETDENKNKTANGKSESPKEDTSKQENKSKTSTKVSETPKKQKLNLAMYQLQVANHKKKNKRIK